jgi:hypothetical protein
MPFSATTVVGVRRYGVEMHPSLWFRVKEPEFVAIPGIAEAKPQPKTKPVLRAASGSTTMVFEYLGKVAKLASKTYRRSLQLPFSLQWNNCDCSRSESSICESLL